MNPLTPILEILNIIGYKGNKDEAAKKLLKLCYKTTLNNLIENLPEDKKAEFEKKFTDETSPEDFNKLIDQYFTADQFQKELQTSTESVFRNYLESIGPTLSEDQKQKITTYLNSLKS